MHCVSTPNNNNNNNNNTIVFVFLKRYMVVINFEDAADMEDGFSAISGT